MKMRFVRLFFVIGLVSLEGCAVKNLPAPSSVSGVRFSPPVISFTDARNKMLGVADLPRHYVNADKVDDVLLCRVAMLQGEWSKHDPEWVIEAKRRELTCGVGKASSSIHAQTSDNQVCSNAVLHDGSWRQNSNSYVQEVRRRGLKCGWRGTQKHAQTASKIIAQTNTPTSARLIVAERKAEYEHLQQNIPSDTRLPTITIASASSNGPQGTVKGRVTDNTGIAEVRVDGKQIQTDRDGNFAATTYVPEGGVSVSIQAIDLAGLSSSMSVKLKRSASNTVASISFERLNPVGRKVAKNKDALALVIGVSKYKLINAKAIYADIDAKTFADYANEKLGIPTNRIKTLVNDGADESGMLLAVKDWLFRASKKDKSDVFVFFAGHGLASQDGKKMYLLPYNGSPRLLDDTAILKDRLFSDIALANPRSVTVFLDTCYSGTTRGTDMLIASRPIAIKALKQSVPDNFTVMTAAAGDQTAKPLGEAKHGMFSYFLMKGMEGKADHNQDNKITAGELHEYVQSNVVQQSFGSQTPELQGDANRVLVQFQ